MKQITILTLLLFFYAILSYAAFDRALNQPVNLQSHATQKTFKTTNIETTESIGPGGGRIQSILCMENIILAGTASGGLYKSNNSGQSWEHRIIDPKVNAALNVGDIAVLGSKIYAAAGCGIYVSHNRGDTWHVLLFDIEGYLTDIETDMFKANTLYIGCYKGDIYRGFLSSSDGGLSWHSKNNGLTNTDILCLAASPSTEGLLYVGTTTGIFRTFNAGSDGWQNISSALPQGPVYSIACSKTDSSTVWAGTNMGLYKSTNSGENWVQIKTTEFKSQRINTIALTSDGLLVGTENGLYKSKDKGQAWQPFNQGLLNRGTTTISCTNDSTTYAGTYDGFYIKQNHELAWKRSVAGMSGHEITDILISPQEDTQDILVGTAGAGLFNYDGLEWSFISPDSGFFFITNITSNNNTILTSGITYQRGLTNSVVYSLENSSLKEKSTHLLPSFINCVAFENDSTMLGAGLFSIDVPTRVVQQLNVPQTIHLQQNYPNPFNSTTTIQFSLANPSHVYLDIYNVKGQEIYSISKECVQAGEYWIKWNGENQAGTKVSAGVYVCRLTGEHFSRTIKMTLLP